LPGLVVRRRGLGSSTCLFLTFFPVFLCRFTTILTYSLVNLIPHPFSSSRDARFVLPPHKLSHPIPPHGPMTSPGPTSQTWDPPPRIRHVKLEFTCTTRLSRVVNADPSPLPPINTRAFKNASYNVFAPMPCPFPVLFPPDKTLARDLTGIGTMQMGWSVWGVSIHDASIISCGAAATTASKQARTGSAAAVVRRLQPPSVPA
jgi:hypothetical protein